MAGGVRCATPRPSPSPPLYYALRLTDGSVLRLAATQYSVWMLVLQALQPVAAVMLLALCLALWLAGRLSRQLVEPINCTGPRQAGGSGAL